MDLDVKYQNKFIALETHSTLIRNQQRNFDIYIQLAGQKYVSICSKGQHFEPERLDHYVSGGLKYFYASRFEIESMIAGFDLDPDAVTSPENHFDEITQVFDILATSLTDLFTNPGEEKNRIQYVQKFSQQIASLVSSSPYAVSIMLHQFSKSEYFLQRALQSAVLAVNLFKLDANKPADLSPFITKKEVFEAAFLMDVGLGTMNVVPNSLGDELSHPADETFQIHPLLGMDYLVNNGFKNTYVLEAVEQHHERSDGKGFPLQLGEDQICYLAQIIGLADIISIAFCVSKQLKGTGLEDAIDSIKESELLFNPRLIPALEQLVNIGFL